MAVWLVIRASCPARELLSNLIYFSTHSATPHSANVIGKQKKDSTACDYELALKFWE